MTSRLDPALIPPFPDLRLETALWAAGVRYIAGLDETGRGALAGPVAAAALVLPANPDLARALHGLNDSKAMTPAQRERMAGRLEDLALAWQVGYASPEEVDALGILPATRLAMQRALEALPLAPDHLLIDYLCLTENPTPQTSLTKGDARSLSIAGASVLAKVHRDRTMCELDAAYPLYGFAAHKGYGTPRHRAALARWGPSPVHRFSFAPLRSEPAQVHTHASGC